MPQFYGWLNRPAEVEAFISRLPFQSFAQAAPHLMHGAEQEWIPWEQGEMALFGKVLPAHFQEIGDCFVAGTLVTMADGTEKPIEAVQVGESVRTHLGNVKEVTDTIEKRYAGELLQVTDTTTLRDAWCTPDHRFAFQKDDRWHWLRAMHICCSEWQSRKVSNTNHQHSGKVYCLEVADDHSFLASGMAVSNCVSHGWGRGVQDQLYINLARTRPKGSVQAQELIEIATEPIYATSRIEIGKGRIGRGDGSVGAWAAEAVQKYGVLPRKKFGSHDLSKYRPDLAKAWGAPKQGLPDELEPESKLHIVQYVAPVVQSDEAVAAFNNGYGIPVCSDQGFTEKRDSRGICKAQGSWAHCMLARTRLILKGNIWVAVIQQSWGNNPTGPDLMTLESGREVKLPQGCFGADWEVFVRMLKQRDSFAVSGPEGFAPRKPVAWNMFNQK